MQFSATWVAEPPPADVVNEAGLYWILPQYKPDGYIGKTLALALEYYQRTGKHIGYPETIKGFTNHKIPMGKEYQRFWFDLLLEFSPPVLRANLPELKNRWRKLTSGHLAFTNGFGSDTHADYINGTNLGVEPMRQETITLNRNIVKSAGSPFSYGGELYLPTVTIDRDKPPPLVADVKGKRWLIHRALVIRSNQLADGTYMENPFDHLDGNDVPVPWQSRGGVNALPMSRLVPLAIGDAWPSYYNK
jgi:hypothetical protein